MNESNQTQEQIQGASTKKSTKVLAIIVVGIFIFLATFVFSSENKPNKQTIDDSQTQTSTDQKNNSLSPVPTPEAPQFSFDVPSLIGKNIDEVKQALGAPNIDTEPTKQQLDSGVADEWEKEFKKNNESLLVTYYPKTKVVTDFFISGSDKQSLLNIGNLKEKDSNYVIEFVKAIKNPSDITGVKISKKLPEELNVNVTYSSTAFKIENKESYNWRACKFSMNSKFDFTTSDGIKANDSLIIQFSEFTDNGERFNFLLQKPEDLSVACDTNGQHRTNYLNIK